MTQEVRVLVIIGTRPEAIKMVPVIRALQLSNGCVCRTCLTGQHTTLAESVLIDFGIYADYYLKIMRHDQTLYDVLLNSVEKLRDVLRVERPDICLVQGDTATVVTAALVCFLERTMLGHVEAGLRSHDKWAPFPEEVFRRLTGVLADLHFAPTPRARDNLLREGVPTERIFVTGNTVVDALISTPVHSGRPLHQALRTPLGWPGKIALLTAHRRESFGAPLRDIFAAVRELVDASSDLVVIYPVHPNPNVRIPATEILGGHDRIHLLPPLDYFDLVAVMRRASIILTDSGGIQEEAPTFGVPVLVLREVTERPEGVEAGVAELVGTDRSVILGRALAILESRNSWPRASPYGDGRAGERIADVIRSQILNLPRETDDWQFASSSDG